MTVPPPSPLASLSDTAIGVRAALAECLLCAREGRWEDAGDWIDEARSQLHELSFVVALGRVSPGAQEPLSVQPHPGPGAAASPEPPSGFGDVPLW